MGKRPKRSVCSQPILYYQQRASECARAGSALPKAPQTTVNWSDLEPTQPAIWIVTLWRPRGSLASLTVTPDAVGLACASIRLVMSMPREDQTWSVHRKPSSALAQMNQFSPRRRALTGGRRRSLDDPKRASRLHKLKASRQNIPRRSLRRASHPPIDPCQHSRAKVPAELPF